MDTADHNTPLLEDVQLEKLCRGFLASRYYRKALEDIRYVREQAIGDYLREQALTLSQTQVNSLEEVVAAIRRNYYRYF